MYHYLALSIIGLFLTGCVKDTTTPKNNPQEYSLRVKIRNITKTTLYATCFAYIKKDKSPRWRWNKSGIYELIPTKEVSILIDSYRSQAAIPDAYGVLGVFTSYEEAQNAIYELTPDENKVDLDRLQKIQDKTIVLGIEKYGVVGDIFDYSFIPDNATYQEVPELDFTVENKTNKPLYVTAFIYQKKDDMPIWHYDKSEIIKINPNSESLIDVDTIVNPYDRKYTRGYLAVFDETEKQEAYDSTFQLLKDHQMINVGILSELQDRKIILKNQKYGILGDVIDFVSKEPRKISNLKSENIKYQPRYS
jgi:hypothetical protein